MKKFLSTLILILISTKAFPCDCEIPKPALEFYNSKYVFKGKVISKIYSSDSLTYTVTFKVLRHFKNNYNPKIMEFTFPSEGDYTGIWTSCDWNINEDENWLVYADYWNDKLTFGYYCSNSKPIDKNIITERELKVLENGNSFKLENYIYSFENNFNHTKPITNIDSILRLGKIKNYEKPHTFLRLLIDNTGNLKSVSTNTGYETKTDSIFNLTKEFKVKDKNPLTEFQKDAIELVKKISKWEIKRDKKSNIPVSYIRGFSIEFDQEEKKWNYHL